MEMLMDLDVVICTAMTAVFHYLTAHPFAVSAIVAGLLALATVARGAVQARSKADREK